MRVLLVGGVVICNAAASYCWYLYITPFLQDIVGMPLAWISPFLLCFGICTILSKLFHPGTTFMASACSPTAFNIGVALGTAVGSLTVDTLGLAWTSIPGGIFMSISAFLIWYIMQPERRWLHRLYPS